MPINGIREETAHLQVLPESGKNTFLEKKQILEEGLVIPERRVQPKRQVGSYSRLKDNDI